MIHLKTEGASLDRLEDLAMEMSGNILPDSITRALNRAVTASRTEASKSIRRTYNLSAAEVKSTFQVRRPTRQRHEAMMISSGERIPLSRFGARQTRRGVSVNVRHSTGRKLLFGAFFGDGEGLPSSRVFIRSGAKKRPGKGSYAGRKIRRGPRKGQQILRQPIKDLYSLSVPDMLRQAGVQEQVIKRGEEVYLRNLESELRFRIDRAIARVQK
ncbi:hypothetical protein [Thioalkalivibrio sp. ALE12]|uniref:hypothetical protein n=1 Tax=Thioalkalivibrio sp. ALE12 TaxID=1158170 RepID=UPI0003732DA9|nr:hypothetical protein [Thioalkalivibrio sp. ALE12]